MHTLPFEYFNFGIKALASNPLQAFLAAVYSPGDLPLTQAPENIVSCAICIGKQIKIRGSSKELHAPVVASGSSQDSVAASMGNHMGHMMAKGNHFMSLVCDKAKALDQLLALKMGDHEQPVLLKSASGSTSASDGVAGLLSQRALPSAAEPAALPLPAARGSPARPWRSMNFKHTKAFLKGRQRAWTSASRDQLLAKQSLDLSPRQKPSSHLPLPAKNPL